MGTTHVCNSCCCGLKDWFNRRKALMSFAIPMIWREPRNHVDDCYCCLTKVKGFSAKNRKHVAYPNLDSAIRPVLHSDALAIPQPPPDGKLEFSDNDCNNNTDDTDDDELYTTDETLQTFSHADLNDLVRDLNLPKESAELLASRLKEKYLLDHTARATYFRNRHQELMQFFVKERDLVFCNTIAGLLLKLGMTNYVPEEWRLFIDSSKRSLKCVLLHNGNEFASVPLAHSTRLEEQYEAIKYVLEKIKYNDHQWLLCVDLKMVNFLLGQQSGYTKFPCFLCLWNSRDRTQHYTKKEWPLREAPTPLTSPNVIKASFHLVALVARMSEWPSEHAQ